MKIEELFWELYRAPIEDEVEKVLSRYCLLDKPDNWRPYGQNESNFGVVENQQASPIPSLIEKITNGIDAILVRRCIEEGIDPRSKDAPTSIEAAVNRFFPKYKNWDLGPPRRLQAEHLQILADGPRKNTSLIIYDDGEGQLPNNFEDTFLSLLRGNKNEIHFVHGKYNMGGAGAIAFCGKKRYQLIGSKRFNDGALLGFTLVRRHPLTSDEEKRKKATWYEYLIINNEIPSFPCEEINIGLYKRNFNSGTIIKLYSYDLPRGSRSVISRDLNQSINEYLFNPALPLFTIDKKERYPHDKNLHRDLYGLKRRLEEDDSKYVDKFFSEVVNDQEIGKINVNCYVFKPRVDEKSVKETKSTIRREFFKNNMSVLFSVDGQVHGHYTSEFITRSLKFPLLKDYLLIHVDCTKIRTGFRNELFMASRDRLKQGEESTKLRHLIAQLLAKGRLKDIHRERKASITVEGKDAEELVRNITRDLPIRNDLVQLLSQTFKLEKKSDRGSKKNVRGAGEKGRAKAPKFSSKRYPSFFSIDAKTRNEEEIPIVSLPLGGERTIKFSTDVEDQYFDRVRDPGELEIAVLDVAHNEEEGGDEPGLPNEVSTVLNVTRASPHNGIIRVTARPTKEVKVGDSITIGVTLSSPDKQLDQIVMVKILDREKKPKNNKGGQGPDGRLGLPQLYMLYQKPQQKKLTWNALEDVGIEMNHDVVVHPFVDDDNLLQRVYINMDSNAWLSHRSKLKKEEAINVAEKRYVSAVYFHTLFLYTITKSRKYGIVREPEQGSPEDIDIEKYILIFFNIITPNSFLTSTRKN